MKCVFVTGGSGFLGRNLIRTLLESPNPPEIHVIARSAEARAAIEKLGSGVKIFEGDLSSVRVLTEAARGCDVAVHCAASTSLHDPIEAMRRANVEGTQNVVAACRAAGVRRLVHVGTEAACTDGSPLRFVDESTPLPAPDKIPRWARYSLTKNEAERAALLGNGGGLSVVVVRPRFIWGRDDSVVLPAFVQAARSGALRWFNGGTYRTSTCHVDNVCEGIVCAATADGVGGESFFLTDGAPLEFRSFISSMLGAAGVPPPVASAPLSVVWAVAVAAETWGWATGTEPFVTRQALTLMGQEISVNDAKARARIGYKGKVSVEEGIEGLRLLRADGGDVAGN